MLECQAVKEVHNDDLAKKQGVVGVGVGHKWSGGTPIDHTPAILIFVEKKRTKRGVMQKFSAEDLIPSEIDGIPTDVIEVGKVVKQAFTQRIRPIKPGFSCGHHDITAGTIGAFFIDKDGEPVVLSNNHVLANENRAKIGDVIFQPGPYDGSGNLNFREWPDPVGQLPYFATLKKFIKLEKSNNVQDSAIAKIHPKFLSAGLIDPLYPTVNQVCSGFGTATPGMQVHKCGRTTGYTTGRVIAVNTTFTVAYDFGPATFKDCVVFTAMSKGGDSGSLIMDMGMKGVAHLFAGSTKVTVANPISYAVNEYGLKTWNPNGVVPVVTFGNSEWRQHTTGGNIAVDNGVITLNAPANQFCFLENNITPFRSVSVVVNTGTDLGATWGPGLTVQWPNGILKVNVRHNDKFGGYFNGTYNISIGAVKPNTDYMLRIRKSNVGTYVGEVRDGNNWFTVIEIPASIFSQPPVAVRVGKTDLVGQASNHTDPGKSGSCTLRNYSQE